MIGVSALVLVLAKKIYLFHTIDEFKDHKKGNMFEILKISIPFGIIFFVISHLI